MPVVLVPLRTQQLVMGFAETVEGPSKSVLEMQYDLLKIAPSCSKTLTYQKPQSAI